MEGLNAPKSPGSMLAENGDEDTWSRQVQTDVSDRGILSNSTSLILDGDKMSEEGDKYHTTASTEDNDDDNWSRQVETDHDIYPRVSSSVLDGDGEHVAMAAASAATTGSVTTIAPDEGLAASVAPPLREEPTLKEKLVERERQRRVETERARLKRQFALRNGAGPEESLAEGEEGSDGGDHDTMMRENGSVAGTVGEGSEVGPVDVLLEDDGHKMNYTMERFLQEQGTIMEEDANRDPISSSKRDSQNQGVLMERFLQEPVVVGTADSADDGSSNNLRPPNVDRSVSFEMDPSHNLPVGEESMPEGLATPPRARDGFDLDASNGMNTPAQGSNYLANVSMDCVTSEVTRLSDLGVPEPNTPDLTVDDDVIHPSDQEAPDMPPESPLTDQPRVLGLTQAEIEELAAIEEVSQQNAPPSERDDLSASSFVAELVSDFGGPGLDHAGTLSQGTPTTAMESMSYLSGNQSVQPTVSENADDQQSIDDPLATASVSSNQGSVSVTANPPSELGHDDTMLSPLPDMASSLDQDRRDISANQLPVLSLRSSIAMDEQCHEDWSDLATLNTGVVNRQIRPGMVNTQRRSNNGPTTPPVRRSVSMPDKMDFDLDGFDYDKNAPASPTTELFPSIQNLSAHDMWSPGSKLSMERSPFRPRTEHDLQPRPGSPSDYGMTTRKPNGAFRNEREGLETEPLVIPDIPSEIVTSSRAATKVTSTSIGNTNDVRSDNTATITLQKQDSQKYIQSSLLQRAFPSRMVALAATLALEIPVLLAVSGGSDRLCSLVGRSSYHLLMGMLPLCCAISGNVGLQSNALTARAVSTGLVTMKNFSQWLRQEVGTAACLGLGMGAVMGALTCVLSGWNFRLGLVVTAAQFVSIVTAAVTGSVAPLLFTFLLEHNADNWSGLMITAVQDLVSTLAMVSIAFQLLEHMGPTCTDASDTCFVGPS